MARRGRQISKAREFSPDFIWSAERAGKTSALMRNCQVNEVVNMAVEQVYGAGCQVTGAYEDGINST